jgi:hypothetical protein
LLCPKQRLGNVCYSAAVRGQADIRRTVQNDASEPGADLIDRAERTRQDSRNSDEAANSGGLGFAKIHRLLRNALDDVTAEFRHLVAEWQEILEGC